MYQPYDQKIWKVGDYEKLPKNTVCIYKYFVAALCYPVANLPLNRVIRLVSLCCCMVKIL